MRIKTKEILAIVAVTVTLLGLPLVVYLYDQTVIARRIQGADRVIELTGVHNVGVWTDQNVNGWNYWWQEIKPLPPLEVKQGEEVLILLRSADVTHSFSLPQLKLGPVDVEAGRLEELRFTADRSGEFRYLCYRVCGVHHKDMKGELRVKGEGDEGTPDDDLGGL